MTITGQIGHLGVSKQGTNHTDGKETVAGLEAYVPANAFTWFVVTEESLVADNAPLMAENEIGRGRDRTGGVAGGYGISGGFGGYARVEDLAKAFEMALNETTPTPAAGLTTLTPSSYLSWWTIEKNVGNSLYLWLVNAKCNSLTLSVGSNAIATYSADFVATMEKDITAEATPLYGTPSFTADSLLAFHGGQLQINAVDYNNMESVEIAINNNLSNDEYTVQPSRFLNDVTEGSRTIDLNFSQVFQTVADYSKYTYGTAGVTTPGYSLYEDDVYFILMNARAKGDATQYIEFTFPRVMFGGLPVNLTNGRIVVDNTGMVLAPANADPIVTIVSK